MKDSGCVTKIMTSWMTLDDSESTKTRRDFADSIGMNKKSCLTTDRNFEYISNIDIK